MADNPALYPPIEPYMTGMLAVDGLHTIYYEQCGNENGAPAIFVHGGPGAGTGADDRRCVVSGGWALTSLESCCSE